MYWFLDKLLEVVLVTSAWFRLEILTQCLVIDPKSRTIR